MPISDLAITTAGDYRKYREVDGQRVAHILDPRTGRPLTHRLASVTVIDALAVRADAFDTALMVLGADEGMALAMKLNLAALFIERTGDGFSERATPRFEEIASTIGIQVTRFLRVPRRSTSSSTTSPRRRSVPRSAPEPSPTVPEPSTSPGRRSSSVETWAIICSNFQWMVPELDSHQTSLFTRATMRRL